MYLELFGKIISEESLSLIIVLELLWLIVFFFATSGKKLGTPPLKRK